MTRADRLIVTICMIVAIVAAVVMIFVLPGCDPTVCVP